jgi:hypothetical protein
MSPTSTAANTSIGISRLAAAEVTKVHSVRYVHRNRVFTLCTRLLFLCRNMPFYRNRLSTFDRPVPGRVCFFALSLGRTFSFADGVLMKLIAIHHRHFDFGVRRGLAKTICTRPPPI